jgi:hypothetical protein
MGKRKSSNFHKNNLIHMDRFCSFAPKHGELLSCCVLTATKLLFWSLPSSAAKPLAKLEAVPSCTGIVRQR